MGKREPVASCGGTVLTYELPPTDVEAAKRQVMAIVKDHPVLVIDKALPNGLVELTVMAGSLTPRQAERLMALHQDLSSITRIASADFDTQVTFDMVPKPPG